MSLENSKKSVSDFISNLEAERKQAAMDTLHKNKPATKAVKIAQECSEAKELTTQDIFAKIYRDALPLDDSYKAGASSELDQGVISFIKKRDPKGSAYNYITERAKSGSIQAKQILESVDREIDGHFRHFYEGIKEAEFDDIKLDEGDRKSIVDKISGDMGYDEVSQIINDHVQQTVQEEITRTKEEDDHLKELQDSLSQDETMTTESAIETELLRRGEGPEPYQPTLFSGIMISQVEAFNESGLDEEHVQKKAFFESVKEYTKWDMLSTLGIENFKQKDVDYLATRYARCEMN
jgi:predicted CopG family antitoxin